MCIKSLFPSKKYKTFNCELCYYHYLTSYKRAVFMSKDNELWNKLCTLDALEKGWHLARTDMQQDFVKEPFSNETFGFFQKKI